MKRYLWLLGVGLLASALSLVAVRHVRSVAPAEVPAAPVATSSLALVLRREHLEPEVASLPQGHAVELEVRNERATPVTLVLQGYEDRFHVGPIAPGDTWRGTFTADRPGEAFPWTVDGETVGRLAVTGSHLVEGHR